jgi:hypothetical protein
MLFVADWVVAFGTTRQVAGRAGRLGNCGCGFVRWGFMCGIVRRGFMPRGLWDGVVCGLASVAWAERGRATAEPPRLCQGLRVHMAKTAG